jgi:uncharacterized protein (TIGR02001 family)
MKTQLNLLILASTLGASALFAETGERSHVFTVDVPYVSSYVFRGMDLGGDAVQPSITYTTGAFNLGVWSNQPIINRTDDEVDFFGGYDFTLAKDWKLTVGGTLYWYPKLDTSGGADDQTFEPKVSISGPLGPVTSSLTLFHDTTLEVTTVEGSLGYSLPMHGGNGHTVDFGLNLGQVSPNVGRKYNYWGGSAKATFRPRENMTIYFGVAYASSDFSGQRNHIYGMVGMSLSLKPR